MGIFKSVANGAMQVIDMGFQQSISNEGFNAGLSGSPPRVIFGAERYRDVYNQSYRLGQESAKTNLVNTITNKIENI